MSEFRIIRYRDRLPRASEIRTTESRERLTATPATRRIARSSKSSTRRRCAVRLAERGPTLGCEAASTERRVGLSMPRDTATMFSAVRGWTVCRARPGRPTRPATNASRRRVPWRRLSPRAPGRPQPGQEHASPVIRAAVIRRMPGIVASETASVVRPTTALPSAPIRP